MSLAGRLDIDRWIWRTRQYAGWLGWQGVAGCSLLLLCLLLVPFWLQPTWIESQHIKDQAEELRASVEQRGGVQRQGNPAAQLAAFYGLFPGTDSIADTLDKIYQAAAENNIILSQGDYSLAGAEGGVLQRYEISIPVRGRYSQVRNFIGRVLAENKNAALLGVNLTRSSATDIGVEAQVRFALYLRDAP